MHADLESCCRFLIKVETATDLDDPTVIEADLPIVKVGVEGHLEIDSHLQQALLELSQMLDHLRFLKIVIVAGTEVDVPEGVRFENHLTEPNEVLYLVWMTDVGVFDNDGCHC